MSTAPGPKGSASTAASRNLGMVQLRSGEALVLSARTSVLSEPDETATSGVIFTDVRDMPSLEQLLEENRIASAVLESEPATEWGVIVRTVVGAVIGGATATAGVVLLIDAVADNAIRANPYTAVSLVIGGIVLLATLLVALRTSRR